MKRTAALILALAAALGAQAQTPSLKKNATLYLIVNNVVSANADLERIIDDYGMTIGNANVNNSKKVCDYELFVSDGDLLKAIADMERLGLTDLKEIKSFNLSDSRETADFDLAYLKGQREIYGRELESTGKNDKAYADLFSKQRALDSQIYEKDKELRSIAKQADYSVIKVKLSEKVIQDLDSDDDFSGFINMPGAETKFFHLENAEGNALADDYFGGSLRYMFTKGRGYFLIGVMKPLEGDAPKGAVNDIVTYSVGKDFYPRYFGQGRNRFLNPFSGFELGGMILTSDGGIDHMFTLEPHLGIELFKNRYVIIDTRVGYLFPLDEDFIKSRRGFTHNFSINFVF
jgi:hypothetical protein